MNIMRWDFVRLILKKWNKKILLITEQGAKVSIDTGKVIIKTNSLERLIPKEIIENVSIFGNVELTKMLIYMNH